MAIDLHIHSINSDGTDAVDEIVEKALEMELEAISITDHEYLTIPKKRDGIEIINGIEVSANWDTVEGSNVFAGIHLLIYFLEELSPITKHLENIRNLKIERNKEIIRKLNKENISAGSQKSIQKISIQKNISEGDAEILSMYVRGLYCPETF